MYDKSIVIILAVLKALNFLHF